MRTFPLLLISVPIGLCWIGYMVRGGAALAQLEENTPPSGRDQSVEKPDETPVPGETLAPSETTPPTGKKSWEQWDRADFQAADRRKLLQTIEESAYAVAHWKSGASPSGPTGKSVETEQRSGALLELLVMLANSERQLAFETYLDQATGHDIDRGLKVGEAWLTRMFGPDDNLVPSVRYHRAAAGTYAEIVAGFPSYEHLDEIRYAYAACLKQSEQEKAALEQYTLLTAEAPESPYAALAYLELGDSLLRQGDPARALEDYKLAEAFADTKLLHIRTRGDRAYRRSASVSVLSLHGRARCANALERRDEAVNLMKRVVALCSEPIPETPADSSPDPDVMFFAATDDIALSVPEEVRDAAEDRKMPSSGCSFGLAEQALDDLVTTLGYLGKIPEARDYLFKIRRDSYFMSALEHAAAEFTRTEHYELAIEAYRALLAEGAMSARAPLYEVEIVRAYFSLHDSQGTRRELDRLLRLYGDKSLWAQEYAGQPTVLEPANRAIREMLEAIALASEPAVRSAGTATGALAGVTEDPKGGEGSGGSDGVDGVAGDPVGGTRSLGGCPEGDEGCADGVAEDPEDMEGSEGSSAGADGGTNGASGAGDLGPVRADSPEGTEEGSGTIEGDPQLFSRYLEWASRDPESLARAGERYLEQGRYELALRVFRRLLEDDPDAVEAPGYQQKIVRACFESGDNATAYQEIDRLVESFGPGSDWEKSHASDQKAIEETRGLLEQRLRELVLVFRRDADNAGEAANYELARSRYKQYLDTFPDAVHATEIRFGYAEVLQRLELFGQAADVYEEVIREGDPTGEIAQASADGLLLCIDRQVDAERQGSPEGSALSSEVAGAGTATRQAPRAGDLTEWEKRKVAACDLLAGSRPTRAESAQILLEAIRLYHGRGRYLEATSRAMNLVQLYPETEQAAEAARLVREAYVGLKLTAEYGEMDEYVPLVATCQAINLHYLEAIGFTLSASTAGGNATLEVQPDFCVPSLTYLWDFSGDGRTDAQGARVSHTFVSPGSHTVTVTAMDALGNTKRLKLALNVKDSIPRVQSPPVVKQETSAEERPEATPVPPKTRHWFRGKSKD